MLRIQSLDVNKIKKKTNPMNCSFSLFCPFLLDKYRVISKMDYVAYDFNILRIDFRVVGSSFQLHIS